MQPNREERRRKKCIEKTGFNSTFAQGSRDRVKKTGRPGKNPGTPWLLMMVPAASSMPWQWSKGKKGRKYGKININLERTKDTEY